jgi:hypothetical protein
MELHTENRPPTKSQKIKTLLGFISNFYNSLKFVEHAQKCLPIISFSLFNPKLLNFLRIHCLHNLAFSMVYAVVKVFEFMSIKVLSGSIPYTALSKSIGSTLAKNLIILPYDVFLQSGCDLSASYTNYIER